eukprot:IDg6947t1
MAPELTLTNFDYKGRAEAIRLAFIVGGIDFEDERISLEEFEQRRERGEFPFKLLPILKVDGKTFAESNGILRYAGNLAGLYPKCITKAMSADIVLSALETVGVELYNSNTEEKHKNLFTALFLDISGSLMLYTPKQKGRIYSEMICRLPISSSRAPWPHSEMGIHSNLF